MKKPNIDFSKDGMSNFFLHHSEKIILGVAVLTLGYLFWNGWSTPKYTATEPKRLSDLASRAQSHIANQSSWDDIKEFRYADTDADERIDLANNSKLDAATYNVGRFRGTKAATLGLRLDPELVGVEELAAVPFRAPVLLRISDYTSRLSLLDDAGSPEDGEDRRDDRRGEAGGGSLGEGGDDDDDKKDEDVDPMGDVVPGVQSQETVGIRPEVKQGTTGYPIVSEAICVTGVVNFDAQFKKYEQAFRDAIGYYPKRDRPLYQFMEVQRKEILADGTESEWLDISDQWVDGTYAMRGPEVVDLTNYDPVLTRDIPPLTSYDYRQLAMHPKVAMRNFVPTALSKRNDIKKQSTEEKEQNIFDDESVFDQSNGNDRGGRGGRGGREEDEGQGDNGFQGSFGGGRGGSGERGGGGGNGNQEDVNEYGEDIEGMKGSNFARYESVDPLMTPKAQYKLVRFFDYRVKAGSTYKYRVRLWLNDPNDPEGYSFEGGTLKGERDDGQLKGSAMSPGDGDDNGGDDESEGEEDLDKYTYIKLDTSLQHPDVRARVRGKEGMEMPGIRYRGEDEKEVTKRKESLEEVFKTSWATEWSAETAAVTCGSNPADFYAGSVLKPAQIRYEEYSIPRDEPSAKVVAAYWSKRLHTAIPTLRTVRRADVLNFVTAKSHVLDSGTGNVKRVTDEEIKTDAVVVDIMGGDSVEGKFKLPVEMPSEMLVMDSSGKFRLQNNVDDLRGYRHSLFLDDETAEIGTPKEKSNERGDNRGGNRGGGDDRDDFFN